jgi:hypothetical protein
MTDPEAGPSRSELLGGWDERFAKVVRVFVAGDVALAIVDTNGDAREVMLEPWEREGGRWLPTGSTSAFGVSNAGRSGGTVFAAGETRPRTVVEVEFGESVHKVVAGDDGLWAWIGRDDSLVMDLPRQV